MLTQHQRTEARNYANSGDHSLPTPTGGPSVTLPSNAELKSQLAPGAIVRLPGAVAVVDTATVQPQLARTKTALLITPLDLTDAQLQTLADLPANVVRVEGRRVAAGTDDVLPGTPAEWYASYAADDVTELMPQAISLAAGGGQVPATGPDNAPVGPAPTQAQLAPVLAALHQAGVYRAPGAEQVAVPGNATEALGAAPLVLVFGPQSTPPPDYAPAVAKAFPGRPVLTVIGTWLTLGGTVPGASTPELNRVLTASLFSDIAESLSSDTYATQSLLDAFINRADAFQHSGLLDRPLPSTPFDPLAVTLPALPFVFALLVVLFVVLTARRLRGPGRSTADARRWSTLNGLSDLAVEVSGLLTGPVLASYTRGVKNLAAAGDALRTGTSTGAVDVLLRQAESELDTVADGLQRPDYRPAAYLAKAESG